MSEAAPKKAALPAITAGGNVAAIVPQNLDEAYRLAQAIAGSGMAPKDMDTPQQIMIAIMAGAELGIAPFQAIQSFAIINNRPTMWGDALIAVVRAHRVRVREWIEGEGDATVAWCEITRPDTGESVSRSFSYSDARKAGLSGKKGPWQDYPKRMLQMRARAFALRDGCADMLRGIQVREEVEDYQPIHNLAPQPAGVAARLEARADAQPGGFSTANVEDALAESEHSGDPRGEGAPEDADMGAEIADTDAPAAREDAFDFDLFLAGEADVAARCKTAAEINELNAGVRKTLASMGANETVLRRWATIITENQARIAKDQQGRRK